MINASVSYYKDKNDFEVDCILELSNGKWRAIEIKFGAKYSYKHDDEIYIVLIGNLKN